MASRRSVPPPADLDLDPPTETAHSGVRDGEPNTGPRARRLQPGDTLLAGRYRIVKRLGEGGMGVVYEAHDSVLDGKVALKTLTRVDARNIYRMKSEFRSLVDVGHPNLVRLHELFVDGDQWFFTMQLVTGRPFVDHVRGKAGTASAAALADTISISSASDADRQSATVVIGGRRNEHAGPVDEGALRDCLKQLVRGVDAIHRAGKLHRDLKPSNILVTPDGHVVILDFGLVLESRVDADRRTDGEEGVSGTPGYMAPEQCRGERATAAADWYAVGVILYQALTGELPFDGNVLQILNRKQHEDARAPIERVPTVPADLNQLCVALLQRRPESRPLSSAVLESLGGHPPRSRAELPSGVGFEAPAHEDRHALFVGRKRELHSILECLRDTESGRPVVALVMGPSGIGKSAVVERFLDGLRGDPDVVVLSGRCYEREAVPYKALDGAIDALTRYLRSLPDASAARLLPRHVHALCRLFPVLDRVDIIAQTPQRVSLPAEPQELRQLGFAALKELLARITDGKRLVISVDDLQWGDADSFHLLDAVLGSADPPSLLFLGTCRGDEEELGTLVGDLLNPQRGLRDVAVRKIPVEPLRPSEVEVLVKTLAPNVAGSTSAAIHTESGGNPFLVAELVRHAGTTDGAGAVDVDAAFSARMVELPQPARAVLDLVALAGRPVDRATAAAAIGMDRSTVRDAVETLRLAGLVRAVAAPEGRATDRRLIATYHDRIRVAVTDALSEEARRDGHRRLGETLEQSDVADAETLSHHFLEAGDLERAGRYALQAAERAGDGLAFERAAMLYRIALDHVGTDGEERLRLCVQLAQTLVRAGRDADSADAYLEASRCAMGAEHAGIRLDCQRRAAEQLMLSGELEQGMRVLSDVLAEVGVALPTNPRRAIAALLWDRLILRFRGLSWVPRRDADIPAEQLALLDAYRVVVLTLGLAQPIYGIRFLTRYALLALRIGSPTHVAHALAQYGGTLANSGASGYRAGRPALEEARKTAESLDPSMGPWIAVVTAQEGLANLLIGRFADAHEELARASHALDSARSEFLGLHLGRNLTRLLYLTSLRVTGRFGEFVQRFETVRRDAVRRGDRYTEATTTRMHNSAWLCRDQPEAALRALDSVGWAPLQTGLHIQNVYELRARAEVDLYLAERIDLPKRYADGLRAFDRSVLRSMELDWLSTAHVRARLWLHNAELDIDRYRALREARAWSRRLLRAKPDFAHAHGELVMAAVKWQRGDVPGATESLRASIGHYDAASVTPIASRFRLGEILGGDEGAELCETALSRARTEGIVDPVRYFRMLAPGFVRRGVAPRLGPAPKA